jgi:hypothetical protein
MVAQVISWNESVFISEFCKRCYESGKYCRSCDWNGPDRISLDTVSSGRSFEIVSCDNCKSAYGISANCQRLIAYQAHLLEDTSPDRIPEYIPRTLAQKRLAAVGTDRDILPTATVIRHKRPEASQKVDKPSSYALLCVLFYSVSCSTLCLVLLCVLFYSVSCSHHTQEFPESLRNSDKNNPSTSRWKTRKQLTSLSWQEYVEQNLQYVGKSAGRLSKLPNFWEYPDLYPSPPTEDPYSSSFTVGTRYVYGSRGSWQKSSFSAAAIPVESPESEHTVRGPPQPKHMLDQLVKINIAEIGWLEAFVTESKLDRDRVWRYRLRGKDEAETGAAAIFRSTWFPEWRIVPLK